MSAPTRYRAPAWRGLNTAEPVYTRVDVQLEADVMHALGTRGELQRMANIGDDSSAFLRLDAADARPLFLKVVSQQRGSALEDAEMLARWLQDAAMPVVASERTCRLADGRQVWVYPFHAGRPPNAQLPDLTMIGSALGKLHGALQQHTLTGQWRQQTDARIQRLMNVREAVARGALRAGPDPLAFQKIASDRSIALHPDMFSELGPRTPLHGDLNRFNMLISDDGCAFLDFEDVPHSMFPAMLDLATVIERVVLVSPDAGAQTQHIQALLNAYRAEKPDVDLERGFQALPDIQRSIALRSLCILAESDSPGLHAEEWSKFFGLISLAKGTIARITTSTGTGIS